MTGPLHRSLRLFILTLAGGLLSLALPSKAMTPPRYHIQLGDLRAPTPFLPQRIEELIHWVEGSSENPGQSVVVEMGKNIDCQTLALASLPPLMEVEDWAMQDRRLGLSFLPMTDSKDAFSRNQEGSIEARQLFEALVGRGDAGDLATHWGWSLFTLDPWRGEVNLQQHLDLEAIHDTNTGETLAVLIYPSSDIRSCRQRMINPLEDPVPISPAPDTFAQATFTFSLTWLPLESSESREKYTASLQPYHTIRFPYPSPFSLYMHWSGTIYIVIALILWMVLLFQHRDRTPKRMPSPDGIAHTGQSKSSIWSFPLSLSFPTPGRPALLGIVVASGAQWLMARALNMLSPNQSYLAWSEEVLWQRIWMGWPLVSSVLAGLMSRWVSRIYGITPRRQHILLLIAGHPACLVSFGWIPMVVSWWKESSAYPGLGHILGMGALWILFQGAGVLLGVSIMDWALRNHSRTPIFPPRPIPGGLAVPRFTNDKYPAWTNYRLLTVCGSWLVFTSLAAPLHQAARLSWPEYQEVALLDGRWIGLSSIIITTSLSPILAYIQLSIGTPIWEWTCVRLGFYSALWTWMYGVYLVWGRAGWMEIQAWVCGWAIECAGWAVGLATVAWISAAFYIRLNWYTSVSD
ncbi:hypothetical protein BJ684DRAFT_18674 [Piptocephalis cylindrospora]|uniref:Uncharacterized protein n=1 Tax=Piptocephalis cylindrospora TaxID=1907219 RepID=A0A4P9Y7E2_9FUNG|nr:hypothetical protein BJ684DRAFT_18674 [Piptocephalis cylindrospora]|eukprot:RKP14955.1 hypothetical protein BJ684DRAFT_18674 [Piptocephalis cylindrospora]